MTPAPDDDLPVYADVVRAVGVVRPFVRPTPLYEWPELSAALGCRFLLKHENHAPTGAFKVRGGVHLLHHLCAEERGRGVIACTTGNHGQSLAYACRLFGVGCTLVVPRGSNPDKCRAMRGWGAELVEWGADYDEARERCESLAKLRGMRYVHSANEPHLIAGVGTYAAEIFDDCPAPDFLIVPVGLGSGICGAGLVAAARSPRTRVIGVQAEKAPAVALSWRRGVPVTTNSAATLAEGIATRAPADMTLRLMGRLVHDFVLVSEDRLREGVLAVLRCTHNLAEGAGAASVAGAFELRDRLADKTVVGVLSGGNLDLRRLREMLPTDGP